MWANQVATAMNLGILMALSALTEMSVSLFAAFALG
jgi:hypothetical protein